MKPRFGTALSSCARALSDNGEMRKIGSSVRQRRWAAHAVRYPIARRPAGLCVSAEARNQGRIVTAMAVVCRSVLGVPCRSAGRCPVCIVSTNYQCNVNESNAKSRLRQRRLPILPGEVQLYIPSSSSPVHRTSAPGRRSAISFACSPPQKSYPEPCTIIDALPTLRPCLASGWAC